MSLIQQVSSGSVNLHFVGKGRRRGFAGSEDDDGKDRNEEESDYCTHHCSSHSDGVCPLGLGLV